MIREFKKFETIRWYHKGIVNPNEIEILNNEAVKWYHKGKFKEDTKIIDDSIEIGDTVRMKDRNDAVWTGRYFEYSGCGNGNMMGTVSNIKQIEGFICVQVNGGACFYKMECVEKVEKENEAVRWYYKGKFEKEEEEDEPKTIVQIGDHIKADKASWWNGHTWKYYGVGEFRVTHIKLSEEITKDDYEDDLKHKEPPPIERGRFYYRFLDKWPWFIIDEDTIEILDY